MTSKVKFCLIKLRELVVGWVGQGGKYAWCVGACALEPIFYSIKCEYMYEYQLLKYVQKVICETHLKFGQLIVRTVKLTPSNIFMHALQAIYRIFFWGQQVTLHKCDSFSSESHLYSGCIVIVFCVALYTCHIQINKVYTKLHLHLQGNK